MLNIIGAIISGLVIGALARFFYPGEVEMNWITTIFILNVFSFENYHNVPGLARALLTDETFEISRKAYLREPFDPAAVPTDLRKLIRPEYFDPQFFANSAYGRLVAETNAYRWVIRTPVRTYYGLTDEAIRIEIGQLPMTYQKAIGNDKVLKLFDYGSLGMEARRAHLFDSFLPTIGYYVVRVQEYEDVYHYMISATTGAMTAILERPVVSPDNSRALSWHDSQMVGRTLDVVRITPARATPEKVAWEPNNQPDEMTYNIVWAPDSQAIIVTETNSKTRQRKTMRLVFKDGAWRPA